MASRENDSIWILVLIPDRVRLVYNLWRGNLVAFEIVEDSRLPSCVHVAAVVEASTDPVVQKKLV